MPEYLSPGFYVEEIATGPAAIERAGTTTTGLVGETERGPMAPTLVTSYEDFRRKYGEFGGAARSSYMTHAVDAFFANGGSRAFIACVRGAGSKTAELSLSSAKSKGGAQGKASKSGDEEATSPPPTVSGDDGLVFNFQAIGEGNWGNNIEVETDDGTLSGIKVTIRYWSDKVEGDPTDVEVYDDLSVDPTSQDHCERRINGVSNLVQVEVSGGSNGTSLGKLRGRFTGGSDGEAVALKEYLGSDEPGGRTGLAALKTQPISILVAPDEGKIDGLPMALVEHCELRKDCFAVLQCKVGTHVISELRPPVTSDRAAFYYPCLIKLHPVTGQRVIVPPGGHIAGVYARTDTERGVWKAPANAELRATAGPECTLTRGDVELLNPRGVNCICTSPRGTAVVWGARTTSKQSGWKYVSVRRLFLSVEQSIEEGTQWVVFEPNSEALWARVKQSIVNFLLDLWKEGALMGTTAEEACFVKCDRTTMTQSDIDSGRLIVYVGVAPVRPAEFVILRFSQKTLQQ